MQAEGESKIKANAPAWETDYASAEEFKKQQKELELVDRSLLLLLMGRTMSVLTKPLQQLQDRLIAIVGVAGNEIRALTAIGVDWIQMQTVTAAEAVVLFPSLLGI